jgi:ketosteroid isomerase-like protein
MRIKVLLALMACAVCVDAGAANSPARAQIEAFNLALKQATTRMDNGATLALWEEDGITLLPQTKPIVGKKAIARFLDDVMAQLPHAQMEKFELQCFDIEVRRDWASEWCQEHQRVQLGGGKPPFEGSGVMLLVLHRDSDGKWRMKREMWNQAPG